MLPLQLNHGCVTFVCFSLLSYLLLPELLFILCRTLCLPSVLWCCWLGSRKGIWPVKNEWWGAGMVICLERDADLHMAQLMPLQLTASCFSKIQIGFSFLVPAHPGSPGKKEPLNGCVCVCVILCVYSISVLELFLCHISKLSSIIHIFSFMTFHAVWTSGRNNNSSM